MGLDLLPTFCDFAGVNVPAGLTGRSLRPMTERSPTARADEARGFVVVSEVDYKSPHMPNDTSGFSFCRSVLSVTFLNCR